MQADRLLREMHKLCCHDLPNQIVVAQTLLQLLAEDEADRLSADGAEFVRRLQNALGAAREMARILRELLKLADKQAQLDPIEWEVLARDWHAKIAVRFADDPVELNCTWNQTSARGDAQALSQAVLEFLALVLPVDSCRRSVELRTEDRSDRAAFICRVNIAPSLTVKMLCGRAEWLLVRNGIEAAGAECESVDIINDQVCLVILLAK